MKKDMVYTTPVLEVKEILSEGFIAASGDTKSGQLNDFTFDELTEGDTWA